MMQSLTFLTEQVENGIVGVDVASASNLCECFPNQIRIGFGMQDSDVVPMTRCDQTPMGRWIMFHFLSISRV